MSWNVPADLSNVFWEYQEDASKRPYWEWFHEYVMMFSKTPVNRIETSKALSVQGVIQVLTDFGVETRINGDRAISVGMTQPIATRILETLQGYIQGVVDKGVEQAVREVQVEKAQEIQKDIIDRNMDRLAQVAEAHARECETLRERNRLLERKIKMYEDFEQRTDPPLPSEPQSDMHDTIAQEDDKPIPPLPPTPDSDILGGVYQTKDNMEAQMGNVVEPLESQIIHFDMTRLKRVTDTVPEVKDEVEDEVKDEVEDFLAKAMATRRGAMHHDSDDDSWSGEEVSSMIQSHVQFGLSQISCMACGQLFAASKRHLYECHTCTNAQYCSSQCRIKDWVIHRHVECDHEKI